MRLFPNMGSLQKVLGKRKRGYYQCFLFLRSLQWDLHTDVPTSFPRLLLSSINSCKRVEQADWNLTNCFAFSLNLSRSGNFHEKSQPTLSTAFLFFCHPQCDKISGLVSSMLIWCGNRAREWVGKLEVLSLPALTLCNHTGLFHNPAVQISSCSMRSLICPTSFPHLIHTHRSHPRDMVKRTDSIPAHRASSLGWWNAWER